MRPLSFHKLDLILMTMRKNIINSLAKSLKVLHFSLLLNFKKFTLVLFKMIFFCFGRNFNGFCLSFFYFRVSLHKNFKFSVFLIRAGVSRTIVRRAGDLRAGVFRAEWFKSGWPKNGSIVLQ